MTKVIAFPAVTTPGPYVFLWILLSIAKADTIVVNGVKTFLAKKRATFINGLANFLNKAPRNPPYWMILENCGLLSFISVDILSAKTFFVLIFYLVVMNNLRGNSSSWKFFLIILKVNLNVIFNVFLFYCILEFL